MSRRCLDCGGKRGSHSPGCERLAVMRSETARVHPTTPEQLAARSLSRAKRRGRGKPARVDRNRQSVRHSRERRGWVLDAAGEFVPPLPEPVGRIPEGVELILAAGYAGSRVLYLHRCPVTGNDRCWFAECTAGIDRCFINDRCLSLRAIDRLQRSTFPELDTPEAKGKDEP